jgi:hypothetical protein
VTTLQTDLTAEQGNVSDLQSDVTTLQSDLGSAEGDISTLQEETTTLFNRTDNLTALETSVSTAQNQLDDVQQEQQTLRSDVDALLLEVDGGSNTDSPNLSELESSVTTLQTEVTALQGEVTNLDQRVGDPADGTSTTIVARGGSQYELQKNGSDSTSVINIKTT